MQLAHSRLPLRLRNLVAAHVEAITNRDAMNAVSMSVSAGPTVN